MHGLRSVPQPARRTNASKRTLAVLRWHASCCPLYMHRPFTFLRSAVRASLAILVLLFTVSALAVEVAGVRFAERITVGNTPLLLNGVGFRRVTFIKVKVYVAGLYVAKQTRDAAEILRTDRPKSLIAVMRRDVSAEDGASAFRKGVERSAGADAPKIRSEIDAFARWIPSMREGQGLTVNYNPDSGVVVTSAAKKEAFRGSVPFGTALFGVWIGPRPVDEDLRESLLRADSGAGS